MPCPLIQCAFCGESDGGRCSWGNQLSACVGLCLRMLGGRISSAVVLSGQVVPADSQHLLEHARAINEGVDAGVSAVSPCDRDFRYLEAEFAGEEKNLGIESPALDLLPRENRLGRRAFERLESALRVGELKSQCDSQKQVEDASEELTVQRLALSLQLGAQPARSDGDIGAGVQSSEKLRRLFDRRGQVGIAKEDDTATRVEHPVADTVSLAVVTGIFDQTQRRIFGGEGLDDICGVVAGTVVDDDDFSVPALRTNVSENLLKRGTDASALVIGR